MFCHFALTFARWRRLKRLIGKLGQSTLQAGYSYGYSKHQAKSEVKAEIKNKTEGVEGLRFLKRPRLCPAATPAAAPRYEQRTPAACSG